MAKCGTAGQATDYNMTRRMRSACRVIKTRIQTHTHPEYVIHIVFPRRQWIGERASMLPDSMYIAGLADPLPRATYSNELDFEQLCFAPPSHTKCLKLYTLLPSNCLYYSIHKVVLLRQT